MILTSAGMPSDSNKWQPFVRILRTSKVLREVWPLERHPRDVPNLDMGLGLLLRHDISLF